MAEPHQYIPTLNKTGFTTTYMDALCREGLAFSKGQSLPVLDIGCAYGLVTLPLLAQGNRVVANDLEPKHLEKLRDAVPESQRSRLTLISGAFPEDLRLDDNSLSCAISSWVFHFFSPEILVRSAEFLFRALAPEGKVFLSASSPYLKFLAKFIRHYEEQKTAGLPFPGWMPDVARFLDPGQVANLPRSMHFLDPEVLSRVFADAGFKVESAAFFHRDDCTEGMFLDGRENVGLIAQKLK